MGGGVVCSGAWDDTETIAAFVRVHPSGTLSKLSCLKTSFSDPKESCWPPLKYVNDGHAQTHFFAATFEF